VLTCRDACSGSGDHRLHGRLGHGNRAGLDTAGKQTRSNRCSMASGSGRCVVCSSAFRRGVCLVGSSGCKQGSRKRGTYRRGFWSSEIQSDNAPSVLSSLMHNLVATAHAQSGGGTGSAWTTNQWVIGTPRNGVIEPTRFGAVLPESFNHELSIPVVASLGTGS
jgi:hypothetical protein